MMYQVSKFLKPPDAMRSLTYFKTRCSPSSPISKRTCKAWATELTSWEDRQVQSALEPISQVVNDSILQSDNGSIAQSTLWADGDPMDKPDF